MANIKITSPVGEALWPRLNSPDTKFHEHGLYKVDLAIPAKEAKAFIDTVSNVQKAVKGKPEMSWVRKEVDEDGKETGRVVLRFKAKNILKKDGTVWDRKPTIVDTEGDRMVETIGNGSKIRVAAEIYTAVVNGKVFLQLQPLAVQVHELKEYKPDAGIDFKVKDNDEVEALPTSEDESLF